MRNTYHPTNLTHRKQFLTFVSSNFICQLLTICLCHFGHFSNHSQISSHFPFSDCQQIWPLALRPNFRSLIHVIKKNWSKDWTIVFQLYISIKHPNWSTEQDLFQMKATLIACYILLFFWELCKLLLNNTFHRFFPKYWGKANTVNILTGTSCHLPYILKGHLSASSPRVPSSLVMMTYWAVPTSETLRSHTTFTLLETPEVDLLGILFNKRRISCVWFSIHIRN